MRGVAFPKNELKALKNREAMLDSNPGGKGLTMWRGISEVLRLDEGCN